MYKVINITDGPILCNYCIVGLLGHPFETSNKIGTLGSFHVCVFTIIVFFLPEFSLLLLLLFSFEFF